MSGCKVCQDAIANGKVRCHCPKRKDGSTATNHDHKWEVNGGMLSCPVKLYEDTHGHDGHPIGDLKGALRLVARSADGYDPAIVASVKRGLV